MPSCKLLRVYILKDLITEKKCVTMVRDVN